MRTQLTTNIAIYGLLTIAAAASILLPASLGPRQTKAAPPVATGDTVLDVNTVVRDFKKGTPDFGSTSVTSGHFAGNINPQLNSAGKPTFVGVTLSPVNDFKITDGATVPSVSYAPMVTVIGSAIVSGSYDCPVTVRLHIGNTTVEPFGSFASAVKGNVNTVVGNPRAYIHPSSDPANTGVWVEGRAFVKTSSSVLGTKDSDWKVHATYGSSPASQQVKVLRNGDSVPNIAGFQNQASVKTFLQKYVNTTTKKVTLQSNQSIYLFELGTSSMSSSAADFQDLVVLVTLGQSTSYLNSLATDGTPPATVFTPKGYKVNTEWRDSKGNPIPPALFGTSTGDVAGSKGAASTGGITSTSSFDQWYGDVMGTNLSNQVSLKLKKTNDVWEYLTDSFHPVDAMMFGNEGKEHNFYFTLNFGIDFMHHAGEHRFFEFQGDDGVWVFVDGKLAMDLGGISPGVRQYLDVDRLGLSDGQKHHIDFFYAQRQEATATFRLRTNLDLGAGTTETYTITAAGD